MRNAFIDTVITAASQRNDVFMISGDAGLGVFDNFQKQYPDKFVNLGVAEQNTTSFASGLALTGYRVYIYNIIPFVLYRCYEQVRNDICYQKAPVVLVGIGSGITYAPQGMTHYSIEDIGIAQTLPNLTVFSPIDPVEAVAAAEYSLQAKNPVYVRLAKRGEPRLHGPDPIDVTKPQLLQDGKDIALVFHGSIGEEVVSAGKKLNAAGIFPKLISVPMVQPLPYLALTACLEGCAYVVSVEEHVASLGLGGMLARAYAEGLKPAWELRTLGLPGTFIHDIKDRQGMRQHFGISAEAICAYVKKMVDKGDLWAAA